MYLTGVILPISVGSVPSLLIRAHNSNVWDRVLFLVGVRSVIKAATSKLSVWNYKCRVCVRESTRGLTSDLDGVGK